MKTFKQSSKDVLNIGSNTRRPASSLENTRKPLKHTDLHEVELNVDGEHDSLSVSEIGAFFINRNERTQQHKR